MCIASSVTTIGLGSFGIYELASFKRAEKKKMSLCRINLFVVFILFFLSQKTTNNEKKRAN